MNISLQEETYDSHTPSDPSSRTSIVNGTQQNGYSQATGFQSDQDSISNFSVHTATATIDKGLLGLSGLDPLPNHSSDSSRGRSHSISDRKSFHNLSKPTLGLRNQSRSTLCTTREPEPDRSPTATSTPSISFLEDEADSESSPSPVSASEGDSNFKVVMREKDWWREGRTGKFPTNYVEPLPEPSLAELVAEAQQEATVFSEVVNADRLLLMLGTLDPKKENLADNEEIQELYRSCVALRPKIVKLIVKYSQKRAELVLMDETFVRARTVFDRMMDESLAHHSELYEQQHPAFPQPQSTYPRTNLGRGAFHAEQLQMQPQLQVQPPSQVQQAPQPHTYSTQDNSRAQPQQAEAPPQPEPTQISGQPQPQPQQPSQVQSEASVQMQPQAQTQSVVRQQHQAQVQTSHSAVETKVITNPQKLKKSKVVHTPVSAPAPKPPQPTPPVSVTAPHFAPIEENFNSTRNALSSYRLVSKRHRTMSDASAEASDGLTAGASTVSTSSANSIRGPTPKPSLPQRDPRQAIYAWQKKEAETLQQGRARRRQPGVHFEGYDDHPQRGYQGGYGRDRDERHPKALGWFIRDRG